MTDRNPKARAKLGHTEMLALKLHPDLMEYIDRASAENYCSRAEYLRQLIIKDMRSAENTEEE